MKTWKRREEVMINPFRVFSIIWVNRMGRALGTYKLAFLQFLVGSPAFLSLEKDSHLAKKPLRPRGSNELRRGG